MRASSDCGWEWPQFAEQQPVGALRATLAALVSLEFPECGTGRYPLIIVLCHYAMRIWDRAPYGARHLYGHIHGRLPPQGRSLDVGVDSHDFRPVRIDALATRMPPLASSHIGDDK